jgi:hypothetical protein
MQFRPKGVLRLPNDDLRELALMCWCMFYLNKARE